MKKAKFYIVKRGLNKPIFEQVQGYTDFIADGEHIHEIGYHKPNAYEWSATYIDTGLLIVSGKSRAECKAKAHYTAVTVSVQQNVRRPYARGKEPYRVIHHGFILL